MRQLIKSPWMICVLLVVGAGTYFQVINAEYIWDDKILFVDSTTLRMSQDLLSAAFDPILEGTSYIRPMVMLSFIVQFEIFGPSASVSHSVNLIFYLINVLLLFLLLRVILRTQHEVSKDLLALAGAALYLVHPAMVEPVAWVAGRFDLFVTTFTLIALYIASINAFKNNICLSFLVGLMFFCACMSKEMAVVFPLAWGAVIWACRSDQASNLFDVVKLLLTEKKLEVLFVLIAGISYLIIRSYVLENSYHLDSYIADIYSGEKRLFLVFQSLAFYLKLIFIPFVTIGPMHPLAENTGLILTILGCLCAVLTLFLIYRAGLRFSGGVLFAALSVISLLPVLNLIPLTIVGNIGHDRFLCLPLVFVSISAAYLIATCLRWIDEHFVDLEKRKRHILYSGLFSLWLVGSYATVFSAVPMWQNNMTLWRWAYEKHPENPLIQVNLLAALTQARQFEYAQDIIADIYERQDDVFYRVKMGIAVLKSRLHEYDEALKLLQEVRSLDPDFERYVENAKNGIRTTAIEQRSFESPRLLLSAVAAFAEVYLGKREYEQALIWTEIGLFHRKDYPPLHLVKALALHGSGRFDEGVKGYFLARRYILEGHQHETDDLLNQFAEQECSLSNREVILNSKMCHHTGNYASYLLETYGDEYIP